MLAFNDMKKTNIVLIGSGGHSYRYCNSVLVEPHDPDPARRYKMAYFDWGKNPGLFVAFSPDGIHWTKHSTEPLSRITYGITRSQSRSR